MAVKYKIYQSKRNDRFKGRWYARAVHEGTVTTDDLADIMQDNCTVKRSDILAVISELVEVMRTQLQNSMRVKLDRFGTFKLGISTTSAEKAKDFTPGANIKGIHVLPARAEDRRQGQPHTELHLRSEGAGGFAIRHREGARDRRERITGNINQT